MSQPYRFTPVTEPVQEDRDFVPLGRCKDKLLIVRPLEYQREGFKTKHSPEGTDVVFADVAVLDEILPYTDPRTGMTERGFPAGHQFRSQAILQGFLKGAFKRYIGETLLGTIYFGVAEKGFPPLMWRDLSAHPVAIERAQRFLIARPEFLIPVQAQFSSTQQAPVQQDPWSAPLQQQPSYNAPQSAPPAQSYQPDPWASASPQQPPQAPVQEQWANAPAAPSSAPPAARPMTTLEQMKQATTVNHQGGPQTEEPPF